MAGTVYDTAEKLSDVLSRIDEPNLRPGWILQRERWSKRKADLIRQNSPP